MMKTLAGTRLLVGLCVGVVISQVSKPALAASTTEATVKQVEQDYGDAIKAADTDKLNQILDDDWTCLGQTGKILTKESFLDDLKSGRYKLESFEMGPMYVKVLGNVAVVQGSVNEKSTWNGEESSRKSVWMDVLVKRGDKWVVIRSQVATAP